MIRARSQRSSLARRATAVLAAVCIALGACSVNSAGDVEVGDSTLDGDVIGWTALISGTLALLLVLKPDGDCYPGGDIC